MRKFGGKADIVFTKIYTSSVKYKNLPFCIESFSHYTCNKDYFIERADLESYVILYSIKGDGVLEYLGNEYKISDNQVIFIDSSIQHKYSAAKGKGWEFYFMIIRGVGVKAYYDILFSEKYYVLDFFDNVVIKKFIDTMLFIDSKHSHQFELLACRQINDLFIQISFLNSDIGNISFLEVIEYIDENFDKKISVNELAKIASMSKYHFIRKFKAVYSETPYGYITRVKVNKAKALLLSTNNSVDEISIMVGFNDTITFIRSFKNFTGNTPNKYRNGNIHHTN